MGNNSGPSGKRFKRAYRQMQKAGVENAMAKGYLFGRPLNKMTKREIIPARGNVIWPDTPHALVWVDLNPTPWSRAEAARINREQTALFVGKVNAIHQH